MGLQAFRSEIEEKPSPNDKPIKQLETLVKELARPPASRWRPKSPAAGARRRPSRKPPPRGPAAKAEAKAAQLQAEARPVGPGQAEVQGALQQAERPANGGSGPAGDAQALIERMKAETRQIAAAHKSAEEIERVRKQIMAQAAKIAEAPPARDRSQGPPSPPPPRPRPPAAQARPPRAQARTAQALAQAVPRAGRSCESWKKPGRPRRLTAAEDKARQALERAKTLAEGGGVLAASDPLPAGSQAGHGRRSRLPPPRPRPGNPASDPGHDRQAELMANGGAS